jgi:hypothetical protein
MKPKPGWQKNPHHHGYQIVAEEIASIQVGKLGDFSFYLRHGNI